MTANDEFVKLSGSHGTFYRRPSIGCLISLSERVDQPENSIDDATHGYENDRHARPAWWPQQRETWGRRLEGDPSEEAPQ